MTAGATMPMGIIDTGPSRRGWHGYELILVCPAKFAWAKLGGGAETGLKIAELARRGLEEPAAPLIRGTLLHIALAHLYEHMRRSQIARGGYPNLFDTWRIQGVQCSMPAAGAANLLSPDDALEEMIGQYEDAWPDCTVSFRKDLRRALGLYVEQYAEPDDRQFEIVGVEVLFEDVISFTGRDGQTYTTDFTQRVDLIVRARATGLIYYFDHKGTSRIDVKVKKRYTLSGQFLAMRHLGNLRHGSQFGDAMPNLVGIPVPGFSRAPLEPAPYALARWPKDVVFGARLEKVLRATFGTDPTDWPGSPSELTCWTTYGPCPYHNRCQWGVKPLSIPTKTANLALEAAGLDIDL